MCPLLFNMFINDLDQTLENTRIKLIIDPKPEGQPDGQLGILNRFKR